MCFCSGESSPVTTHVQERNVNGMKLVQGSGNEFLDGKPLEDDKINTVYILDSNDLPFHRAELYHQFHDGMKRCISLFVVYAVWNHSPFDFLSAAVSVLGIGVCKAGRGEKAA